MGTGRLTSLETLQSNTEDYLDKFLKHDFNHFMCERHRYISK